MAILSIRYVRKATAHCYIICPAYGHILCATRYKMCVTSAKFAYQQNYANEICKAAKLCSLLVVMDLIFILFSFHLQCQTLLYIGDGTVQTKRCSIGTTKEEREENKNCVKVFSIQSIRHTMAEMRTLHLGLTESSLINYRIETYICIIYCKSEWQTNCYQLKLLFCCVHVPI